MHRERTLFSYTIPWDDGSAPNPYFGKCTLAICKPAIRRVAQKGDWVVGLGARTRSLEGRMVYAMRVTEVVTMREYDFRAAKEWPGKIPRIESLDEREKLGDCLYDFSREREITQRPGVHGPKNKCRDLRGKNVLLSEHFFYFGGNAVELPPELLHMTHPNQGHKSRRNRELLPKFEEWVSSQGWNAGELYGCPGFQIDWTRGVGGYGSYGGQVRGGRSRKRRGSAERRVKRMSVRLSR